MLSADNMLRGLETFPRWICAGCQEVVMVDRHNRCISHYFHVEDKRDVVFYDCAAVQIPDKDFCTDNKPVVYETLTDLDLYAQDFLKLIGPPVDILLASFRGIGKYDFFIPGHDAFNHIATSPLVNKLIGTLDGCFSTDVFTFAGFFNIIKEMKYTDIPTYACSRRVVNLVLYWILFLSSEHAVLGERLRLDGFQPYVVLNLDDAFNVLQKMNVLSWYRGINEEVYPHHRSRLVVLCYFARMMYDCHRIGTARFLRVLEDFNGTEKKCKKFVLLCDHTCMLCRGDLLTLQNTYGREKGMKALLAACGVLDPVKPGC